MAIFSPNRYQEFKGRESNILLDMFYSWKKKEFLPQGANPNTKLAFRAVDLTLETSCCCAMQRSKTNAKMNLSQAGA